MHASVMDNTRPTSHAVIADVKFGILIPVSGGRVLNQKGTFSVKLLQELSASFV